MKRVNKVPFGAPFFGNASPGSRMIGPKPKKQPEPKVFATQLAADRFMDDQNIAAWPHASRGGFILVFFDAQAGGMCAVVDGNNAVLMPEW